MRFASSVGLPPEKAAGVAVCLERAQALEVELNAEDARVAVRWRRQKEALGVDLGWICEAGYAAGVEPR